MSSSNEGRQFALISRVLHWTMAVMILSMLFIGVSMVASLADYHTLVSIHRPLGALIFVLAVIRAAARIRCSRPPYPLTMGTTERYIATASELVIYGLMLTLPLVGWGMLSAARYPIVLYGPVHLPFILPHDAKLYAALRELHTWLAYGFFFAITAHFGAIMFHAFVLRDGIIDAMVPWRLSSAEKPPVAATSLTDDV